MTRRALVIASMLLVYLPSIAVAQRGGGGSRATKNDPMFDKKDQPKGVALRTRDIEDQSPIRLLIDKRKDLKLSDQQVDQLKAAEDKLKEKNAPLLKVLDSLVRDMRPQFATQSTEDKARIRAARIGLLDVLGAITTNYDESAKEAVGGFDPDQQAKANDMVAKKKAEAEKFYRDRLADNSGA